MDKTVNKKCKENPREEYTITANTTLGTGTSGGYGILFETSLVGTSDTGYALQFDRGLNKIVVRPRTNGKESTEIIGKYVYNDDGTKIEKDDAWWSEEHEVTLKVEKVAGTVAGENNFTGLRSWGGTASTTTTYENLSIR